MARLNGKDRGITQRKGRDGWSVRIFHNGRERWHKCDTKSQAKALYGRLKAEAREGKYFPDRFNQQQELTLRAWIGRYREGITSRGLRNMHHYGRFWSKLLGRRLLTEIAPDELRRIQAKMMAKKKRTPQTINRYFAGLRRVLNLAIAEGLLVTNPVKAVKFFPEPSGRLRFLSDIEIAELKKKLTHEEWLIVAFALETGLRLTEQFKARWDCVDLERGILTVPLSKSGRTRHVLLSDAAVSIVRSLSSSLHSQYLFPSPLTPAQPIQGRNFVVKVYMPALERAGIQGATWHTLRHTFASRAVMGGVDIRTVQELMGHSTVTMTMRYAHLSPAHLKLAVNKGSLGCSAVEQSDDATVTKTVTCETKATGEEKQIELEPVELTEERSGGAGRVRTAASQFCRLLP